MTRTTPSARILSALTERLGPGASERIFQNEPMAPRTTFRVGGPADCLLSPASSEEIALAVRFCREYEVPLTLMGAGSNVLVSDLGIRGLVVSIGEDYARIGVDKEQEGTTGLFAEAGARLSALAAFASRSGLSGLEAMSGIPGSVGGAVYMNAGAYERSMQDVVFHTDYLDAEGCAHVAEYGEQGFGYRRSLFMDHGHIVTRTTFRLVADAPDHIAERVSDYSKRRRSSQPLELPSAGSVFRRPIGNYAGRLVEESGMKGESIGGAQVSSKHAGFIVNTGGATASDVRRLMEKVQRTVESRTGIRLEPEILMLGEW